MNYKSEFYNFIAKNTQSYPNDLRYTKNGCEYSIFENYEDHENFHIEIDPTFIWTKDDLWELVNHLMYKLGELDEYGNLINETEQKPLFLISHPGKISIETAESLGRTAKEALETANIDAVTLVLSDGINAYFEKP